MDCGLDWPTEGFPDHGMSMAKNILHTKYIFRSRSHDGPGPAGRRRPLLWVALFCLWGWPLFGQAQQVSETFTTYGTFTVPSGVTEIIVEVWGGGGGGASGNGGRGGGGGGAYARSTLTGLTAGTSYSFTVGTGGGPGSAGGASTFGNNLVRADGGRAGSGSSGGAGGSGGTGQVVYPGGNGANASGNVGGGGGSSAGSGEAGRNANAHVGGIAPPGGGNGGSILSEGNNSGGAPGSSPGGGGAGKNGPGGGGTPGSGAPGRIVVTYVLGTTYSLSGTITDAQGQPVEGVSLQVSGGYPDVITDASGQYLVAGIPAGGQNITLVPGLPGFSFEPASRTIPGPLSENLSGLDFTALESTVTYSIAGTVQNEDGTPRSGAVISVTGMGNPPGPATTNASGQYLLEGIPEGASLTLTPSYSSFDFSPPYVIESNIQQDLTGRDFIALDPSNRFITGTILDESGQAVEGVTVTASGDYNQAVSTNSSGAYVITGMGSGGLTIRITPSFSGYAFSPVQRTVDYHHNSNPRIHGQDFTAISEDAGGPFYSRQSGAWEEPSTWSRTGHDGTPAARTPEPNDPVYVGSSHVVALNGSTTTNEGITVYDGGTLSMGAHVVAGPGSFSLASDGVLQIGAPGGISQAGSSGNVQTAGRHFSGQATYVYNGSQPQLTGTALPETVHHLTIDNAQGVTALSGHRITGLLSLQEGLLSLPPGASLAASQVVRNAGNLRMQVALSGSQGWRMISSPVQTTFADLFSGGFVTQGFDGSQFPALQPNVLWFDESHAGTTNEAWRTPASLSDPVPGGKGYFFFVFDGAGMPGGGSYSDALPRVMDATGAEHAEGSSSFDFGLTFNPREAGVSDSNSEIMELNQGWNLVANPSTASVDWDASGGWDKSGIGNTIYVWDPGMGDYLVYNGFTGSGTSFIAPFQAFWVRAEAPAPVLRMHPAAKGLGGSLQGKQQDTSLEAHDPAILRMELRKDSLLAIARFTFTEQGQPGEDPWDAYRLQPLGDTFLKLYTISPATSLPLVINNLPKELDQTVTLPLYVGGQAGPQAPISGQYLLEWHQLEALPEEWTLTLMDHELKTATSMKKHAGYAFDIAPGAPYNQPTAQITGTAAAGTVHLQGGGAKAAFPSDGNKESQPAPRLPLHVMAKAGPVAKASPHAPRFTVVINPHGTEAEEPEYIPHEAQLQPNFPNPFAYGTTLRFSLPEAQQVSLEVFDLQGRRVARLADGVYEAGTTTVEWTPNRLPGGIYIAVMRTPGRVETVKMSLLR